MTSYINLPRVMMLHVEQERIINAIDMLDAGGTVGNFSVGPPPPDSTKPLKMGMMAVNIPTNGSTLSADFLADVRAWLEQRQSEINDELTKMGVTETPTSPKARAES